MSVISEEPRVGFIIKHKTQKGSQQLTFWRSQISTISRLWQSEVGSYPPTEEPRIGIISRLETHQGTAATHILKSQEQSLSAGLKHTMAQQPLTSWRTKNSHCQQAWNTSWHSSHSHPEEPRTVIVSRLETHHGTAATHILESQGQASSAGLKHTKAQQPLTYWRAKNSHCQQAWNTSRHSSHSHPGEPRTVIVSRLETHHGTAATHILESQGQSLSAGLKHPMAQQPLTSWRAKDSHCQQAWNIARHSSHSHSRKSKIGLFSRFSMQWGMATTHPLERRIQHGLFSRCEKCEWRLILTN